MEARWRGRKLHSVRARARLYALVVVITESRGGLLSIAFVHRSIGRSVGHSPARRIVTRDGRQRRSVARTRSQVIRLRHFLFFAVIRRPPPPTEGERYGRADNALINCERISNFVHRLSISTSICLNFQWERTLAAWKNCANAGKQQI